MFANLSIVVRLSLLTFLLFSGLFACKKEEPQSNPEFFQLLRTQIDGRSLSTSQTMREVSVEPLISIQFSSPVDTQSAKEHILLNDEEPTVLPIQFSFLDKARSIEIRSKEPLNYFKEYNLIISDAFKGAEGQSFPGISYTFETEKGTFELVMATINGQNLKTSAPIRNVTYNQVEIVMEFSEPLNPLSYQSHIFISPSANLNFQLSSDQKTVTITNSNDFDYYENYTIVASSSLQSSNNFMFTGFSKAFSTGLNPNIKKPLLSDDDLLDLVQSQTFKYFWDYAHPVSGLVRERYNSGETVTIGGSGFGVMSILVGIHRNIITRSQGVERLQKIVDFLSEADRFHGVWPHWMNGSTGTTIPFSANDNGADLVETAFMAQGLITAREFLDSTQTEEKALQTDINELLNTIEWDWFTRGGQDVLYWHWSPDKNWAMNMQIKGYNEALIVYVLAASSQNHGIDADVYHKGWASNGNIRNNKMFYGYTLPVGYNYGGPLFFAHYSFLGLDPRTLSDTYAHYWEQNRAHTLINYEHAVRNPFKYLGYSEDSWGFTASDDHTGYGVHEPTRDNGTISPTAALSSFPYTPE